MDIQTKGGAFDTGGEESLYAGEAFDTVRPSFELAGTEGKLSYFADGSYDHNSIGDRKPNRQRDAGAVDTTPDQYKAFTYLLVSFRQGTSRLSFMGSGLLQHPFQVPDTRACPLEHPPTAIPGSPEHSTLAARR